MITMGLSRSAAKNLFFDREAVALAVDKGTRQALLKTGAIVMRRARNSIKESRRYQRRARGSDPQARRKVIGRVTSKPGEPPRSITGQLKDGIWFAFDPSTRGVVIGPVRINTPTPAPRTLEFGGTVQIEKREVIRTRSKSSGRFSGATTTRTVLRRVKIAARPYMSPALMKALPRIPEQFRDILSRPGAIQGAV